MMLGPQNNVESNSSKEKNEIINLKNQLSKANRTIEEQKLVIKALENKLNTSILTIKKYHSIISKKEEELNNLKTKLKNNNITDKIYKDQLMCVNFISTDQTVHYAIPCSANNTFAEIEEKLYQRFPEYRETNNTFLANGQVVLRFKTISQNNIGGGLPVTLVNPNTNKNF
jgi:chromosome segregation ATPase